MTEPREEVCRLPDVDGVAHRVAGDLVVMLAQAQHAGRTPALVLTGGSVSRAVHAATRELSGQLDWGRVDIWWGDERYVPSGDDDRNAGQAWADLLSHVATDRRRVHEMPAADGQYPDVTSAASAYAHELRRAVESRGPGEPWFDVLMLGIGPDGHCASLFPGREELASPAYVLPVIDAPKPPPVRITLGMQVLRRARHVLFVATGAEKAAAVAASVASDDVRATPAAGPRGLESTTWYVDEAAASAL